MFTDWKMARRKEEPLRKDTVTGQAWGVRGMGTRVKDAENKSALSKKMHFILGE